MGASTELFIAAPSLGSIVVSATLPQPTAPAARNTMPSPPPASPKSSSVTWEGAREGVTHLSQPPYLPNPEGGQTRGGKEGLGSSWGVTG